MLFTQIEFFVFFAVVFGFLLVVRRHRARKLFLLAASYYFYAYWDWRFLSLILTSTLVDYFVSLGMEKTDSSGKRRALLIVSLGCNLGILGFFKYFNFFVSSFSAFLSPLGLHLGTLQIILPIGISFYTFQTLSYTIDVYRRQLPVCRDFFDFALFVAFFPQLVAGPIVRASEFLPQLDRPLPLSWERAFLGFRQFTFGLVKKVFIADRIAMFVDGAFANAGALDGVTTWLSVLCYAVQIYCDFSGYSDMAIGLARAMGFDFRENFNHPYIATSITDFWRRWHISLSTWLRDYLYIPLGGNRKGKRRTYINLMVTMVLGGLWHGAAWTFVVWGTLHGVALAIDKWAGPKIYLPERRGIKRSVEKAAGWLVTMLIVNVAWVLFRSQSFEQALLVLRQMFWIPAGFSWHPPFALLALGVVALLEMIHASRYRNLLTLPADRWYTPVVLFSLLWLVIIFYPKEFAPFIYFQF
jgi:alginate O-acetyltransferase complex protein AlgI